MVNGRAEKRQRRQAAKEARQAERARQTRTHRIRKFAWRALLALHLLGVMGALGWWVFRPKPGTFVASQGNAHVAAEPVAFRYASDPPTSGPHVERIAPWGIHEQPIPRGLQIHNLEDGGVLVQYNCTECQDLIARLKEIVRRYPDKVILAPYPGMQNRIALTAWSYLDAFDEFEEERVVRFIEAHRGIDHHVRR
jgi:hypothetical protein